ncbi:MAG: hypothetical protein KU29_06080, partial [Sulfurovum sp. FS06-10]
AAIGIIVDVLNRGELQKIMKERRMLYEIARLKNHFVICYHNEFTIQVTKGSKLLLIGPSEGINKVKKIIRKTIQPEEMKHV